MYTGPGARIIAIVARLLPSEQRAQWLDEWHAELSHAHELRHTRGDADWRSALVLRARCVAALRDAWWLRARHRPLSDLRGDVKLALRGMRARPAFALSVVATLALGIGGATVMFSVIDPLLLRPLPYPDVERLAEIHMVHGPGEIYPGLDIGVWRDVRAALQDRVFERVEAGAPRWPVVTGAGEPVEQMIDMMTPAALRILGVRPLRGRVFDEADAQPGAPDVVLISEDFWRRELLADSAVIGRTLSLSGRPFQVIGVAPSSFRYPFARTHMWVPLKVDAPTWPVRGFEALVKLRPGVTLADGQAQLDALAQRLAPAHPQPELWKLSMQPLAQSVSRGARNALLLLAGAVGCLLLIACVNAANLLLVRSSARRTELGVRRSLGATGARLFRQLLTESLVLATTGGALGILLAWFGVRAVARVLPADLVDYTQTSIGLDVRVLSFSLTLSLLTGVLFGAGPAVRAMRTHRLLSSERTVAGTGGTGRAGRMLAITELALSMMLLIAAALLARSFGALVSVKPGFEPNGLLIARMSLARHRYTETAQMEAFYAALKERLRASPGVAAVSVADGVPPVPGTFRSSLTIASESGNHLALPLGTLRLPSVVVDDDYFSTLGIPLLAGRAFNAQDAAGAPMSVVIDPDLAGALWPGQSPLGRRFRLEAPAHSTDSRWQEPWLTVIGVAGEVKMMGPDDRRTPYVVYYSARQQEPWIFRNVAVRAVSDPAALYPVIRDAVRALDSEQPIASIEPATSYFAGALEQQRFVLMLVAVFTVLALVLAAIGVYGVVSFLVAQRAREIGLRIAVGATPRGIMRTVLGSGISMAIAGGVIGLAGALAFSRFLRGMLYGVAVTDLATLTLVTGVLTAVATGATIFPALRAARTSPLDAMRTE